MSQGGGQAAQLQLDPRLVRERARPDRLYQGVSQPIGLSRGRVADRAASRLRQVKRSGRKGLEPHVRLCRRSIAELRLGPQNPSAVGWTIHRMWSTSASWMQGVAFVNSRKALSVKFSEIAILPTPCQLGRSWCQLGLCYADSANPFPTAGHLLDKTAVAGNARCRTRG